MADKFLQFNDGSNDYNINSQGKIKKSSLGDDSKLKKLFDIFNKNGDDVIDSNELNSLFSQAQKFADADGNSIFSTEEAEQFLLNIKSVPEQDVKNIKWLSELYYDYFKWTNSDKFLEDFNYISETKLQHKIMQVLQNFKDNGQYTDIITKDFSKYL